MKLTFPEEKEEGHLQQVNENIEIGIDEVGRGCIFGPIFSAVVVLSRKNGSKLKKLGLDDSKKLTQKKKRTFTA